MELCGLRRRQELNGQRGEVVGPLRDEGFVQVQLKSSKGLGERLMLRPRCLAPADEKTLEPSKWSPSEASSVRTVSLASEAASEVASVRSEMTRSTRSRSSGSLRSASYTGSGSYTGSYTSSASSHRKLPSIWLKQRSKDLSLNYIPTKVIL